MQLNSCAENNVLWYKIEPYKPNKPNAQCCNAAMHVSVTALQNQWKRSLMLPVPKSGGALEMSEKTCREPQRKLKMSVNIQD